MSNGDYVPTKVGSKIEDDDPRKYKVTVQTYVEEGATRQFVKKYQITDKRIANALVQDFSRQNIKD